MHRRHDGISVLRSNLNDQPVRIEPEQLRMHLIEQTIEFDGKRQALCMHNWVYIPWQRIDDDRIATDYLRATMSLGWDLNLNWMYWLGLFVYWSSANSSAGLIAQQHNAENGYVSRIHSSLRVHVEACTVLWVVERNGCATRERRKIQIFISFCCLFSSTVSRLSIYIFENSFCCCCLSSLVVSCVWESVETMPSIVRRTCDSNYFYSCPCHLLWLQLPSPGHHHFSSIVSIIYIWWYCCYTPSSFSAFAHQNTCIREYDWCVGENEME